MQPPPPPLQQQQQQQQQQRVRQVATVRLPEQQGTLRGCWRSCIRRLLQILTSVNLPYCLHWQTQLQLLLLLLQTPASPSTAAAAAAAAAVVQ
jgi:hypothetical protein